MIAQAVPCNLLRSISDWSKHMNETRDTMHRKPQSVTSDKTLTRQEIQKQVFLDFSQQQVTLQKLNIILN